MFKRLLLTYCTTFLIALLWLSSCSLNNNKKIKYYYESDDPNDIISINPSRPFKYGFAYSLKQSECLRKELNTYNIQKGDVVAEVGAASGWREGVYSVMTDSVTYYVQDIDTVFLNQKQLNNMVKHFSSVRPTPQTNTFKMVIGTEQKTNLPDNTFDKIIITNVYHELVYPITIITDLIPKLKPNGVLIIEDKFSNQYRKTWHSGCNKVGPNISELIKNNEALGLYLINATAPLSSHENTLFFSKNKQNVDGFILKTQAVSKYITISDRLNLPATYSDSTECKNITLSIQPYLKEIEKVYPDYATYFSSLVNALNQKRKTTDKSINISNAALILYPNAAVLYENLSDFYFTNKNYPMALKNMQKAVNLDSSNKENKITLNVIKRLTGQNKDSLLKNRSALLADVIPSDQYKYKSKYTLDEYNHLKHLWNANVIQAGDIIANVGTDGWNLESFYFRMEDTATFYIQNTDTIALKSPEQLDTKLQFDVLKNNYFNKIIGFYTEMRLPNQFFDKIIIHNSLYHFKGINEIIKNIKTKLKPNGIIILSDELSNEFRYTNNSYYKRSTNGTIQSITKYFADHDLYLTNMTAPKNSFYNDLSFGFNKQNYYNYITKKDSVEKYIKILDQFNQRGIYLNKETTEEIASKLKLHIKEIQHIYPSAELYLNSLGYRLLQVDKNANAAINIFKANLTLFPYKLELYEGLAEAYLMHKDYALSLESYKKLLVFDPQNQNAKDKIAHINQLISK